MLRWILAPVIAATLGGCSILSGRCLYELRNVNAQGAVAISGADSAFASVIVGEQRDYEPDKTLSWQVRAPSLQGTVTKIELLDQKGTLQYNFTVDAVTSAQLSGGFVHQSEGANINGFFDMLSTTQARVVISLDDGSAITIPLKNVRRDDWNRPYCS
jgi:hypothetical protein